MARGEKMDEQEYIELPSEEETRELWKKQDELLKWAQSLTKEQIDFLCDGGWYNGTIKGYLIAAAREADFTDKQVNELLGGLRWAFSKKNKADADKIYCDWN